ncbi:hypothetical protein OS189_00155 [Sulfitobacter sp. F26169L]|uniref:hypothetical protein n=1 Tax=Sulfitobacter sp. F26169L TaxID=2996015 RepID=UPI002260CA58|nr:hypothetical protein [Sulfitobacter sp. F26169L]MCX7564752.1 hypothetical protein [Sulfitobacter sp. F26169L]
MRFVLAAVACLAAPIAVQAQTPDGMAAWSRIYAVASHPRCTNCHVGSSGRPAWDDLGYGRNRLHGMNIVADASRIGAESIPCRACHISAAGENAVPHSAPQIDDAWRLPPVELAWRGKSSAEVCTQLRDPETNDGFDLVGLIDHVRTSAFVNYGFKPGAGRNSAPGSVASLAQDLQTWGDAGMPCEEG